MGIYLLDKWEAPSRQCIYSVHPGLGHFFLVKTHHGFVE